MAIALFVAFLSAFLLSCVTCGKLRRLAPRLGLMDRPGERKIHTTPIPVGGGLGIGFAVIALFALGQLGLYLTCHCEAIRNQLPLSITSHLTGLWFRSGSLWTLLGLGGVLLVLGTLDDRFNLNWKFRLGVQTLVAIAAVWFGWRLTLFVELPILTSTLSVLWIVGLINSFNMLDNMNGLSAGIASICGLFLTIVMFIMPNPVSQEPQLFIAGMLLVLIGAIFGFLFHNNPFRATIFMGDGGAYFIGFLLATATLSATFSSDDGQRQTVFVPLLILAVPLYDTTTVVLIRLWNGKSPFVGDKNHFSHRLVEHGLSKTQAVLTIYLTTAICCLGSLFLYQVDFLGASLVFLQTLLVLLLIAIFEFNRRKNH